MKLGVDDKAVGSHFSAAQGLQHVQAAAASGRKKESLSSVEAGTVRRTTAKPERNDFTRHSRPTLTTLIWELDRKTFKQTLKNVQNN